MPVDFKRPLNIILSTTRTWNCGDDFIAYGVKNLIDKLTNQTNNYIAYNRNPDLHLQRVKPQKIDIHNESKKLLKSIDLSDYVKKTNWIRDNSWHERHGLKGIDLVVFAGTPEWFGPMVGPLVEALNESDCPVIYLGIGNFEGREQLNFDNFPKADKQLLSKAKLITVRDPVCKTQLEPLNPILMPCPALLSSIQQKQRESNTVKKVGISIQARNSHQPLIDRTMYDFTEKLSISLAKQIESEWVCHYIDEIQPLSALIDMPLRYSYDPKDYFDIYNQYDLILTTRVHGAGAAASVGVPSFVFSHSARSDTAKGFLSELISPTDDAGIQLLVEQIKGYQIKDKSNLLLTHKARTFNKYLELLKPVFEDLQV